VAGCTGPASAFWGNKLHVAVHADFMPFGQRPRWSVLQVHHVRIGVSLFRSSTALQHVAARGTTGATI
jgi:hypothetical protein